MNGGCGHQLAVLHQAQLGSATANVNVQNAMLFIVRTLGRARAVNRQHGLHVVTGRGAHKLAALFCQYGGNRLTVFTAQGFARQNYSTGVNFIGVQARRLIRLVDDGTQGLGVHQAVTQIRCQ